MAHRCLLALAVLLLSLGAASAAQGLSLTIDPGIDPGHGYGPGDIITITATLDTSGAPAGQIVDVTVRWDPSVAMALNATATFSLGTSSQIITSGANAGSSNLTSLDGAVAWIGPPTSGCDLLGAGAGNTCILLNKTNLSGSFVPDASVLVGTLQLEITALGSLDLQIVTADAFGATPVIVPEPTPATLLALGLSGLAAARRRRR